MIKTNLRFLLYPLLLTAMGIMLLITGNSTFSYAVLKILLRQTAILGLMGIGLSLVVFIGEIDFSIGAILSLGSSVCAFILHHWPEAVLPAVFCSLFVCTFCGLLNGVLVTRLYIPATLVTFAMMFFYSGTSVLWNGILSVRLESPAFFCIFNGTLLSFPTGTVTWVVLLAAVSLTLRYTYWGQYIYAIGDNEQTLRNIGVNTERYKILSFMCCGFFMGLASVFMLARVSAAPRGANITLVFETLAAISLSGIGFSGFRGQLPGLFLGTFSLAVCKICMTVYTFSTDLQELVIALLFLLAQYFGRISHSDSGGRR